MEKEKIELRECQILKCDLLIEFLKTVLKNVGKQSKSSENGQKHLKIPQNNTLKRYFPYQKHH
jgi:hypothetical protein